MENDEFEAWRGAVEIALGIFAAHLCRLSPVPAAALVSLTREIEAEGEAATAAGFSAAGTGKEAVLSMGLTLSGLAETIRKDAAERLRQP